MFAMAKDVIKSIILNMLVLIDVIRRWAKPIQVKVIRSEVGEQDPGSRPMLCVFAHFDKDDLVDDYVVHYLRALDEAGCETVFVSTAEGLDESEIQKILPYCTKFIVKQNIGYDFASWRTGLEAVGDLTGYERVVIANDSVYGPLQDLRGIFAEMGSRNIPFWGITDSLRYGRHLQSYFLVFEKIALQNEVFKKFWRNLPDYRHKHVVINQCEIGLSRRLANFEAYIPFETMREQLDGSGTGLSAKIIGNRQNPTHKAWRTLIKKGGPFLKIQLLRDNPLNIDLDGWETVLGEASGYDPNLIRNHMARTKS
jgi:rhamnosyltransferase